MYVCIYIYICVYIYILYMYIYIYIYTCKSHIDSHHMFVILYDTLQVDSMGLMFFLHVERVVPRVAPYDCLPRTNPRRKRWRQVFTHQLDGVSPCSPVKQPTGQSKRRVFEVTLWLCQNSYGKWPSDSEFSHSKW